jgi:hypothetical protein
MWGAYRFGSLAAAISYVKGQPLAVDAKVKSFGTANCGERVSVSFLLTNQSSERIRILGCRMGCSCTTPDNKMPFTLEAGAQSSFRISIVLDKPQFVNADLALYTSAPGQPELEVLVIGEITPKQPTGEAEASTAQGEGEG